MTSRLEIKNIALAELPDAPIASENEKSLQARETQRVYGPCLRELLEAHEWGFAIRRVALAQVVNDRAGEWRFAYRLPADLGTPIGLVRDGAGDPAFAAEPGTTIAPLCAAASLACLDGDDYVIAGTTLYTQCENAVLEYGVDSVAETLMPALFVRALALDIASRIAMPLGKSRELKGDLLRQAEIARDRAVADDQNRHPRRHSEGYVSEVGRVRGCG